ncbi:hypothetical protein KCP71_14365 [Salmonella enterica subsp. enterica]|nr:hypothetical protein KCP71_14365 [Salmonella enterica subsp. enterica]
MAFEALKEKWEKGFPRAGSSLFRSPRIPTANNDYEEAKGYGRVKSFRISEMPRGWAE